MTAMTERVVALPHGSASAGVDSPPVRRTRVRAMVAATPRSHKARAAAARTRRGLRSVVEVVYLDAADSFLVNERSQTVRQVWNTNYADASPIDSPTYRAWCRVWKPVAVVSATACDSAKFFLIHPVRGPLAVTATAVGIAVATH